jgi:hypothetical protein
MVTSHVVRIAVFGFISTALTAPAVAEHEMDHRFVVEGYVCGTDGKPKADVEVVARDTRASIGKADYTDSSGHYRIQLHLHNDNAGDPVVVSAGEQEQKIRAQFDPKDLTTERKATVHFGTGCEHAVSAGAWMYYAVGLGIAAVAIIVGTRVLGRKGSQHAGRGKKRAR